MIRHMTFCVVILSTINCLLGILTCVCRCVHVCEDVHASVCVIFLPFVKSGSLGGKLRGQVVGMDIYSHV